MKLTHPSVGIAELQLHVCPRCDFLHFFILTHGHPNLSVWKAPLVPEANSWTRLNLFEKFEVPYNYVRINKCTHVCARTLNHIFNHIFTQIWHNHVQINKYKRMHTHMHTFILCRNCHFQIAFIGKSSNHIKPEVPDCWLTTSVANYRDNVLSNQIIDQF